MTYYTLKHDQNLFFKGITFKTEKLKSILQYDITLTNTQYQQQATETLFSHYVLQGLHYTSSHIHLAEH